VASDASLLKSKMGQADRCTASGSRVACLSRFDSVVFVVPSPVSIAAKLASRVIPNRICLQRSRCASVAGLLRSRAAFCSGPSGLYRSHIFTSRESGFSTYATLNDASIGAKFSLSPAAATGTATSLSEASLGGPAWDIYSEYPSLTSPEFEQDVKILQVLIDRINDLAKPVADAIPSAASLGVTEASTIIETLHKISKLRWEAVPLASNLFVFASCESSIDGKNATARALIGRIQAISSKLQQSLQPASLFLLRATDEVVEAYLKTPHTSLETYEVSHRRKLRKHVLCLEEETLITALSTNGITAWGTLYRNIAGSLQVGLEAEGQEPKTVSVATAAGFLDNSDRKLREAAWRGIGKAWRTHEEACAGMLNAITGWRLEVSSRKKYPSFLTVPLHDNRMTMGTLNAMVQAVDESKWVGQQAILTQAYALGLPQLAPWDLFAPPPNFGLSSDWPGETKYSYQEALDKIVQTVSEVHPDMGEFVKMMDQNRWVEARSGESKQPGAYCTVFRKSRTPRVYLSSFTGGNQDLFGLAHELGHSFHDWVMRDMPLAEVSYPLNLAETASIMFETLLQNKLLDSASTPQQKAQYGWTGAEAAAAFLLNIPARFDFERALCEARASEQLNPEKLTGLMVQSWEKYYGPALSEMDPDFWMSKVHFYLSSVAFYNFPYTFGYLFALGVYAQRERLGDEFFPAYVALLRDTGTMDSEQLVLKHLGTDITQLDFWMGSISIVQAQVEAFTDAVCSLIPLDKAEELRAELREIKPPT